jgi:hypothetical protein
MATDDTKAKLKQLRDRLALEAPRARSRPDAPLDLVQRLQSAADMVGQVYLLMVGSSPASNEAREEICEDALVEGHLALHEWERWLEQQGRAKPSPRTAPPVDRRQHDRYKIGVSVRLLRHSVRADGSGGVALSSEVASRPARNVSAGGIFVALAAGELAEVKPGSLVHVSVMTSDGGGIALEARAIVARRDSSGIALGWVHDSDRTRAAIDSLLDAIRRSQRDR